MTQPAKNILIANAIIPCSEDKIFHRCYLCDSTQSYDDSLRHISTKNHAERLKKFETAFVNRDKNFSCKICDGIIDWKLLKRHAEVHEISPWYKPLELYKIFFENQTLEFFGKFYCYPCDTISHNWSAAIVHTNDEKHKEKQLQAKKLKNKSLNLLGSGLPYKQYVCNGIFTCSNGNIGCKICDCSNIGIKNVDQHVRGFRHADKKFELIGVLNDRISRKMADERTIDINNDSLIEFENDFEQVPCCSNGHESSSLNLAANIDESKTETQPITLDIRKKPLDGSITEKNPFSRTYFVEHSDRHFFCIICNVKTTSKEGFQGHISGKRHTTRLDHFHDNGIILMENNNFHCDYCHLEFEDLPRILNHLESIAHKSSRLDKTANGDESKTEDQPITLDTPKKPLDSAITEKNPLSRDYIVEKSETDCFCMICNFKTTSECGFQDHISGKRHTTRLDKFHDNGIILMENNNFYCDYCHLEFKDSPRIWNHIDSKEHKSSRLEKTANVAETKIVTQPITLDIPKKPSDGAITKKNPLSRDYIVEKSETDFSCMICNLNTTSKCDVQGHISGKRHIMRRDKFHDNGIIIMENDNFYCDYCKLEFEDSPRIWNHIDSKEHKSSRLEKTTNVAETKIVNQPITLDIPKKPLDGSITEKNPFSRTDFVEQSDTHFSCIICNVKTTSKEGFQGHISGKRHTTRLDHFHDNGIILMGNNNFHCDYCHLEFEDFPRILNHIETMAHKTSRLDKTANGDESKTEKQTITLDIQKKPLDGAITEKNPLSRDYIVEKSDTDCFCMICNFKTTSECGFQGHISGKRHTTRLDKFHDNGIILMENNNFYCDYCHLEFEDLARILNHKDSKEHKSSRLEKTTNVAETKIVNQPITLDVPKKPSDGAITKKNPLSRDYIVEKSETDFSCMICNLNTTSKCDVQGHISGKRHTMRRDKFHDNGIILMENDNFYCDYCKLEIEDSPRIWNHMDSKEHKSSRLEKTTNVAETKIVNQPITLDIPKKPLDGSITEKNPFSRTDFVEQSDTHFSCIICNVKTTSKEGFQGHISGKRHTTRLDHFHDNGIILMENNNFRCDYCHLEFEDLPRILNHIETMAHKTSRLDKTANGDESKTEKQTITLDIQKKPLDGAITEKNPLSRDYIVEKSDTDCFCMICNFKTTSECGFQGHISGKRHTTRLDKFHDNGIILMENNNFYCDYCHLEFEDLARILNHKDSKEHKSSRLEKTTNVAETKIVNQPITLDVPKKPSDGAITKKNPLSRDYIVEKSETDFSCMICNLNTTSKCGVQGHISGKRHTMRRDKFHDNGIILMENDNFYCDYCKLEFEDSPRIWNHIDSKEHKSSRLEKTTNVAETKIVNQPITLDIPKKPLDGSITEKNPFSRTDFVEQSDTHFSCIICNVKTTSKEGFQGHISGKRHTTRLDHFHDNGIILMENNNFHCDYCHLEFEDLPRILNHIETMAHKTSRLDKTANGDESKTEKQTITLDIQKKPLDGAITEKNPLSRDYIVEKSDTDCFCMICNFKATSECGFQGHISGKRHTTRLDKFHDNGIILMENNNFYCDYCHLEFEDLARILNHKDSKEHKSSRSEKTKNVAETKIVNQPITLDVPKKPSDGAITKKNPLSRDYIVEKSETDFSCMICNLNTTSKCDVQGHISGKRHTMGRDKFHDNGIILMENNNFYCDYCKLEFEDSPRIWNHIDSKEHKSSRLEKTTNVAETKIVNQPITLDIPKKPLDGSITEKNPFSRTDFVEQSDTHFSCIICNVKTTSKEGFQGHISGKRHTTRLDHFHDNGIILMENNNFHCDYCHLEFEDFPRILNHIETMAHKTSRLDKTANGDESKTEKQTITLDIQKKPLDGAITEKNPLSRDYIVEKSDTDCFCMICNFKTTSECGFQGHISGKRHTTRLDKFHDNGIILMENNNFYCDYCHLEFEDLARILNHKDSKEHKSSRLEKTTNVAETKIVNQPITLDVPKKPSDGAITKKNPLSRDYIVEKSETDFSCMICNLNTTSKCDVQGHISGKRHTMRRDKFHDNGIILMENDNFYCDYCKLEFEDSPRIWNHIDSKEHKSSRLEKTTNVAETKIVNQPITLDIPKKPLDGSITEKNSFSRTDFVEQSDTHFSCIICNVKTTSKEGFQGHISGKRHTTRLDRFHDNGIILMENNNFRCDYCHLEFEDLPRILNHIETMAHKTSRLDKTANGDESKTEKQTITLDIQKKPLDGAITEKNPLSRDYIVEKSDTDCYCMICNFKATSECGFQGHISGKRHTTRLDKFHDNGIILMENNNFYCDYCHLEFEDLARILNHKDSKEHKSSRSEKTTNVAETKIVNQPITLDVPKKPSDGAITKKNPLPRDYIVEKSETDFSCMICNLNTTSKCDVQGHISGKRHTMRRDKFHDNGIILMENNKFYCDYCKLEFEDSPRIWNHIDSKEHKSSRLEKTTNVAETKIVNQPITLDIPKKPLDGAITKKNPLSRDYNVEQSETDFSCMICNLKTTSKCNVQGHVSRKRHTKRHNTLYTLASRKAHQEANNITKSKDQELPKTEKTTNNTVASKNKLPYHYIVETNETKNPYCKICDCKIGGYVNIQQHVSGLRHAHAMRVFNVNKIEFKKKDIYHCKYCNCKIYSNLTVKKHIEGYRHLSSLNKSKDPDSNDPKPNFSKLQASKSNFSKPKITSKQQSSENLTHEYIVKINYTDSLCKICNCVILWGQRSLNQHLAGRPHAASLRKYGCENISLVVPATRDYYCKSCDCRVRGDGQIWRHAIGPKHAKSIISCNNNKELGRENEIIDKSKNYIKWRILRRSMKNGKSSNSMNSGRANNSRSRFMRMIWQEQINNSSIPVNCNICKIELPNSVDLHGHFAGHFSKDFTDPNHDNSRNDAMDIDDSGKNNSLTESLTHSISTDSICTLASEGENLDFTNAEIPSGKQLMKYIESGTPNHTPKRPNINKITKTLNFDNDDIYRMNDKLRELEIGMKLSYETFSKKQYCLVCHTTTEFTIENYYEHLCSLDHCMYLERMERDHASFAEYPEQFSEIALGLEYMEEISKDHVLCHACETRMFADDDILREHINKKSHTRDSRTMRDLTMKHFESVKLPINCDWYKVERYHCVPCLMTFGSEVNFFEHMTSNDHLYSMERPGNKNRQLLYDFCESCALLWYGYRRTCAYHRSIDTHLFLLHDGYYLSTKLPKSAKELLAMPELYINETMRIYEESMAEKREKEDLLIRDVELAVGRKFCHAKAYMFGSRVTGMGSLDCDIDVFLDCGDMYNGKMESRDMIMNTIMDDVSECLNQEAKSWIVEELVKTCRSPIIRAHHRPTGLSCDISFENGLAVENTNLIKSYNDAYPLCREMIIFLKRWLTLCKLAGSEIITSYALYWHVIFYLQHESILPSVEELIKIKNQSRTVDGWEVGATRDFTHNLASSDFTIRQLLTGFYDFWSKFDHRYDVACPMIGKILKKRVFLDFTIMTDDESFYGDHVKKSMEREALRIDSAMCLQDPFDLSHNITKAVGKVYVNRFRKYCSYSLDLLLRS